MVIPACHAALYAATAESSLHCGNPGKMTGHDYRPTEGWKIRRACGGGGGGAEVMP